MSEYRLSWDIINGYPIFYFNTHNHDFSEWFTLPKHKKLWIAIYYDEIDNTIDYYFIANYKNELIHKVVNNILIIFDEVYHIPPDAEDEYILDHIRYELMVNHFAILKGTTTVIYIMEINT